MIIFDKIKAFVKKYIIFVQKILITISLFILYVFGFGVTVLLAAVFDRRLLGKKAVTGNTFWLAATGYEPDIERCERQS